MYVRIPKLLNAGQLKAVTEFMAEGTFLDGRETGGPAIQNIKNNRQIDRAKTKGVKEMDKVVLGAMAANVTLRSAVMPKRILPPYYVMYTEGMAYGQHVDNPMMVAPSGGNPLRSDASITVFLSDPETYEGGELMIKSDLGDATIKLAAGDAIVYPTGALHEVRPVTKGERRAIVTWMQSMIADPGRRQIVYELDLVCQSLLRKMPDSDEHRMLMRNFGNLVRLWAEP